MKTIMAEAANSKGSSSRLPAVRVSDVWSNDAQRGGSFNTPQRERSISQGPLVGDPPESSSPSFRTSGSPWRIPAPQTPTKPINSLTVPSPLAATPSSSFSGPQENIQPQQTTKSSDSTLSKPSKLQSSPSRHHAMQPGLGPIFTPSRQDSSSAASSSIRHVS
jgi:inhibitor of Bruton tyrosine kinase